MSLIAVLSAATISKIHLNEKEGITDIWIRHNPGTKFETFKQYELGFEKTFFDVMMCY